MRRKSGRSLKGWLCGLYEKGPALSHEVAEDRWKGSEGGGILRWSSAVICIAQWNASPAEVKVIGRLEEIVKVV